MVWYRRHFDPPRAERLPLHFGAVDYRATVWVNGEEVMRHEGGRADRSPRSTSMESREAKPRDARGNEADRVESYFGLLLTFDRRPKVDPGLLRKVTETSKRHV